MLFRFGVSSISGDRPYMEDRYVVEKDLLKNPELMAISPGKEIIHNPVLSFGHVSALPAVMAFLAVYDGHNGEYVAEILMQVCNKLITIVITPWYPFNILDCRFSTSN